MLTKQTKVVKDLHKEYFFTEGKINREISKIQKKARSDFKRLIRKSDIRAKLKFSSLYHQSFTKRWEPKMYVKMFWGFEEKDFEDFCLDASAKIGIEFVPMSKTSENDKNIPRIAFLDS